jgi:uncharacterized membrane protein YebE (DUF533 family)
MFLIREMIGGASLASMLMPNKRKRRKITPGMSKTAALLGLGVGVYMAYKNQSNR